MPNIATNGKLLIQTLCVGSQVKVNDTLWKNKAPGPLMGDACAISPDNAHIAVVARVGSGFHQDEGYISVNDSPWKLLGETPKQQCVAWINGRFIAARVNWSEGKIYEQDLNGVVTRISPSVSSQGILYYNEISQLFVEATQAETTVGQYKLIKTIQRVLKDKFIYCGQKTGDPDTLFITNANNTIAFVAGPQPNTPQFVVVGEKLIVNGGREFSPPYPTLPSVPIPVPPNPPQVLKKPKVTVDKWTLDELLDGREFTFHDSENPTLGYSSRVYIENGSMYAEMKNKAGSAKTGQARPVKVCPEVPPEPTEPPIPPEPIPSTGKGIKMNGKYFCRQNDDRMTVIECSEFSLFKRYLDNDWATVNPVIKQRHDLGFNTLRVWLLNDSVVAFRNGVQQDGIHPNQYSDFYQKLRVFCADLDALDLCVELTVFTQTETLMPNAADQQRHLDLTANAVHGLTNVLLELVNENDQHDNAVSPNLVRPPGNIIISHGSNGADATGVRPTWDYELYHTNGLSEWQRKTGHNAMEKAEESGVPCVSNENTRFPDNDSSVNHAYDAPAGASLLCAGACYHSQSGKFSRVFDPTELTCAQQWVAGALSVPLEFQPGVYRHETGLEGPEVLRAYSKTLPDGRKFVVKIRP